MMRYIFALITCLALTSVASVPEPSFVVYGNIQTSGIVVQQQGMTVSAYLSGVALSDIELNAANQYQYSLEVPLEAAVGPRGTNKARVGDVIDLRVSGQTVANVLIEERGKFKELHLELPQSFDSDGDGVLDSIEVANGNNPNDPNDPVKFGAEDIDGDGTSNGQEFLTGSYDPNGDYDGDGYSNEDEYSLSKDPKSATNFPKQHSDAGLFSPLHAQLDAITYLSSESGDAWDEQLLGKPISIMPAYWNIDNKVDILVSTSTGNLFVLLQISENHFSIPELITLFSVPTGGELTIGFANFDGINSAELWAYSKSSKKLYIFDRSPIGVPYGGSVRMSIPINDFTGTINVNDFDVDGVPDIIISGIELSIAGKTKDNTIGLLKGRWDGINFDFAVPQLITSQTHINNSRFFVVNNVGEAGFDIKKDILIRAIDQKHYIDLSYNTYKKGAISESLIQQLGMTQIVSTSSLLSSQLSQLNTGSPHDAFFVLDYNDDNLTDLVQYTGELPGMEHRFRLVQGFSSIRDLDSDGIADYKDIGINDANIPLPKGNIDFDGDGIPYAVDGNHSGQEDADMDGIKDGFELANGLNPRDATDKDSDLDVDGRTAFQEYHDGTDPTNSQSVSTQEAKLITSVAAFDAGVSDMVLFGGEIAVTSTNSPSVKIYNINNLKQIRSLESSDPNGVSKVLSVNNLLIMGNVNGNIEIWDVNASTKLIEFNRSASTVTDMAISGNELYSLHADGDVYQWDLERLIYVANWHVYDGVLTSLFVRGDLLYIQSSSPEKIMFVWNTRTSQQVYNITGQADCCSRVVAEFSGETMILANSFSGTGIYAMNINNYNSQEIVKGIDASAIKAVGKDIYIGRKDGVIDWYSSEDGSFIGRVAAPHTYVRKIELINGGFVSLHSDGKVYFWEHK
jgi:hypothetical protein